MPKVKVGDINMYYEIHGEGEPLVFIVGLGANLSASFLDIPAFSHRYKVVLFENRGAGRSDAPAVPYTMAMMADDTVGLMDVIGIDNAHIMGRSLGGMIAQHIALLHPRRVKSLILMSTDCGGPHYKSDPEYMNFFSDTEQMNKLSPEERYRQNMRWLVSQEFIDSNPAIIRESFDNQAQYPTPPQGFAGQMQAIEGHNTYDHLPEIKAPTLIIHGDADQVNPMENARTLASRIPGAELVVMKNMRHLFMLEAQDETTRIILNFLKRHTALNT
jgi:pimeloyl-ACP methyl ester carboxylesterase